jgi:hypothetical protein
MRLRIGAFWQRNQKAQVNYLSPHKTALAKISLFVLPGMAGEEYIKRCFKGFQSPYLEICREKKRGRELT